MGGPGKKAGRGVSGGRRIQAQPASAAHTSGGKQPSRRRPPRAQSGPRPPEVPDTLRGENGPPWQDAMCPGTPVSTEIKNAEESRGGRRPQEKGASHFRGGAEGRAVDGGTSECPPDWRPLAASPRTAASG